MKYILAIALLILGLAIGYVAGIRKATTSPGYFLGDSSFFLVVDGNIYEWENEYVGGRTSVAL